MNQCCINKATALQNIGSEHYAWPIGKSLIMAESRGEGLLTTPSLGFWLGLASLRPLLYLPSLPNTAGAWILRKAVSLLKLKP